MWGLNYYQWILVIVYLLLSYYTYKKFVINDNKTNKDFIFFLFVKFPALIFVVRNYDGIIISAKTLALLLAYFYLAIYYAILIKNYYKGKK